MINYLRQFLAFFETIQSPNNPQKLGGLSVAP
ncbi:hypothetical protein HPSA_01140 [Helicobacter pylori SouthAfrica7]|uniref:Uncharacterized protein n=1 Tax=Helicobacter pylori (strain SouthAfrica7) TaxID=907239 RepID=E8QUN4_HELPW|nr:hypothetical protein HPSA_01140 [Helicobacter pylori SouthAfrica7]